MPMINKILVSLFFIIVSISFCSEIAPDDSTRSFSERLLILELLIIENIPADEIAVYASNLAESVEHNRYDSLQSVNSRLFEKNNLRLQEIIAELNRIDE